MGSKDSKESLGDITCISFQIDQCITPRLLDALEKRFSEIMLLDTLEKIKNLRLLDLDKVGKARGAIYNLRVNGLHFPFILIEHNNPLYKTCKKMISLYKKDNTCAPLIIDTIIDYDHQINWVINIHYK